MCALITKHKTPHVCSSNIDFKKAASTLRKNVRKKLLKFSIIYCHHGQTPCPQAQMAPTLKNAPLVSRNGTYSAAVVVQVTQSCWSPCSTRCVSADLRTPGNKTAMCPALCTAGSAPNTDPVPSKAWVLRHTRSEGQVLFWLQNPDSMEKLVSWLPNPDLLMQVLSSLQNPGLIRW